MIQIPIPNNSYAFLNFITEEERLELKDWVIGLYKRNKLKPNTTEGRFWNMVSYKRLGEEAIPLFYDIKLRIMEQENYTKDNMSEHLNDFISLGLPGSSIHQHTDPNRENHIHTRYNLIVNKAEQGGQPVYNGSIIEYDNSMLWRCEAGKYLHSTTPVQGNEYRINISYGFQVPINEC